MSDYVAVLSKLRHENGVKLSYHMTRPAKEVYMCTVSFDYDRILSLQTQEQSVSQFIAVQKAAEAMVNLIGQVAPKLQITTN